MSCAVNSSHNSHANPVLKEDVILSLSSLPELPWSTTATSSSAPRSKNRRFESRWKARGPRTRSHAHERRNRKSSQIRTTRPVIGASCKADGRASALPLLFFPGRSMLANLFEDSMGCVPNKCGYIKGYHCFFLELAVQFARWALRLTVYPGTAWSRFSALIGSVSSDLRGSHRVCFVVRDFR